LLGIILTLMPMLWDCVQMVSLGLCSVFELLRETQTTHPALCHRALVSLLNILQAQTPEGLRSEPADIVGMNLC